MGRMYKKVKYYECVTIIVDAEKAKEVLCKYQNKGYRSRYIGPKITKFPKCDPNRIKMVLEIEIAKERE